MRPSLRFGAAMLAAIAMTLMTPVASAEEVVFANDGLGDGGSAGFQLGFVAGEMGAACFTPPEDQYPIRLTATRFLFGGDGNEGGNVFITVKVFGSGGNGSPPGDLLLDLTDVEATSASDSLNEVDLSTNNIVVNEPWCIAIQFPYTGPPSIARDDDGDVNAGNNWIYTDAGAWFRSQDLLVQGDWVIRTVGNTNSGSGGGGGGGGGGGTTDAGVDDTGTPDTGSPDAGGETNVSVISVTPATWDGAEDVRVSLTGSGFESGYIYRIGPQQLVALELAGGSVATGSLTAGALPTGTYDVLVVSPAGSELARCTQCFIVTGEEGSLPPTITSVSPNATALGTSVNVTVIGNNFEEGTSLRIGGRAAIGVQVTSPQSLSAFIPGDHVDEAGVYDVEVIGPNGAVALLSAGFTFTGSGGDGGGCAAAGDAPAPLGDALILAVGLVAVLRRRR